MFVAYRLTSIWIAFLKRPCLSFSRAFINEDPCFAFPLRATISRRVGWREVRLLERIEPCVISVSKTARQHLRRIAERGLARLLNQTCDQWRTNRTYNEQLGSSARFVRKPVSSSQYEGS